MHLNPHAKCRSSKFNLKLFKKRKTGVTYNLETLFFIEYKGLMLIPMAGVIVSRLSSNSVEELWRPEMR